MTCSNQTSICQRQEKISIQHTAKFPFLNSVILYGKWWVCESSSRHLQLLLGWVGFSKDVFPYFFQDRKQPRNSHTFSPQWRCFLFGNQMEMRSIKNFSQHPLQAMSNTTWFRVKNFWQPRYYNAKGWLPSQNMCVKIPWHSFTNWAGKSYSVY